MGRGLIITVVFLCMVAISYAEFYKPIDERTVTTGQTAEWYYSKLTSFDTERYIGLSKTEIGVMGIAGDNANFYGNIWLVPSARHNSKWYLCPARNMDSFTGGANHGNGWQLNMQDANIICYNYQNYSDTVSTDVEINVSWASSVQTGQTKINVTTKFLSITPTNTGFAFVFIPENQAQFRYISINGEIYDLTGAVGQIPVDKTFEFLDESQNPIGDYFDWTDMLDTGNKYSEIVEFSGGNKGLMVGTYGYGSSNVIHIDPLYQVDYSPTPALWLYHGLVTGSDNDFNNTGDVTSLLSDNSSLTYVSVFERTIFEQSEFNTFGDWSYRENVFQSTTQTNETSASIATSTLCSDTTCALLEMNTAPDATGGWSGALVQNVTVNSSPTLNLSLHYGLLLESGVEPEECVSIYVRNLNDSSELQVQEMCGDDVENGDQTLENDTNIYFNLTAGTYEFQVGCYLTDVSVSGEYGDCYIDDIVISNRKGDAISTRFSQTYDANYNWYLTVNKITTGSQDIFIYAYNSTDTISTQSTTQSLVGTGQFNVNISSLMDYQTNTLGWNYTNFRVYTDTTTDLSEIYLRQEANDTQSPNIGSCIVNESSFSCMESVRFSCTVTDDIAVDEVIFDIDGTNYSTTKSGDTYYYDLTKSDNITTTVILQNVYATDISGHESTNITTLNNSYSCIFEDYINITHDPGTDVILITNQSAVVTWTTTNLANSIVDYGLSLGSLNLTKTDNSLDTSHSLYLANLLSNTTYYYQITSKVNPNQTVGVYNFTTLSSLCDPNWVLQNTSCLTNDTRLIYYVDTNYCDTTDELPGDNGTYVACNYCSEDLQQDTGACLWNGTTYTQEITYTDNNYYSCCVFTSLPSDCSILTYPYNDTTYQVCNALVADFDVQLDDTVYFGIKSNDKVYGRVFLNESATPYSCISYVKTPDGKLIQSNPSYEQVSGSTINIFTKEYEDREYFLTSNGLANVYWTKENLVIDGSLYVFGVECSSNSSHKIAEKAVTVLYEGVSSPITRYVWLKENVFGLVAGLLILLLLGLALFFVWRVVVR